MALTNAEKQQRKRERQAAKADRPAHQNGRPKKKQAMTVSGATSSSAPASSIAAAAAVASSVAAAVASSVTVAAPAIVAVASPSSAAAVSNFASTRARNAAYGHELCGRFVAVPWAAWAGFETSTDVARGMITKYDGRGGGRFDITFGPEVGSAPLKGVSWAQLFGEAPIARDAVLTLQTLESPGCDREGKPTPR